jgi:hypothetical protein
MINPHKLHEHGLQGPIMIAADDYNQLENNDINNSLNPLETLFRARIDFAQHVTHYTIHCHTHSPVTCLLLLIVKLPGDHKFDWFLFFVCSFVFVFCCWYWLTLF